MRKDEQKVHTRIMKWLQYNKHLFPKSFLIETKVARLGEKRFYLREISEKELRLLHQAKYSSVIQTHSDFGGMGTNCDGSVISGGGFIFLQWVRPHNNYFHVLDIDTIEELIKDGVKSLTEEHCIKMANITGILK